MGQRVLLSHDKYLAFAEATKHGVPPGDGARTLRDGVMMDLLCAVPHPDESTPRTSTGPRDDFVLLVRLAMAVCGPGLVVGIGCNHRQSLSAMIDVCIRRRMPKSRHILSEFQRRITTPRLSRQQLLSYQTNPRLMKLFDELQRDARHIEMVTHSNFEPLVCIVMSDPAAFFETQPKKSKQRNKKK